jgi:hypothetical protein
MAVNLGLLNEGILTNCDFHVVEIVSYEHTYASDDSQLQMQNSKVLKNENEHLNIGM